MRDCDVVFQPSVIKCRTREFYVCNSRLLLDRDQRVLVSFDDIIGKF